MYFGTNQGAYRLDDTADALFRILSFIFILYIRLIKICPKMFYFMRSLSREVGTFKTFVNLPLYDKIHKKE